MESWSGYFEATDPSGHNVLILGSAAAQAAATVPTGAELLAEERRWPTLIALYVGRADDRFLAMNETFDAALTRSGVPHRFRTYPGGHSSALWRAPARLAHARARSPRAGTLGRPVIDALTRRAKLGGRVNVPASAQWRSSNITTRMCSAQILQAQASDSRTSPTPWT